MTDPIRSYLRKKALSGPWRLNAPFPKTYPRIIVIPAYSEYSLLPGVLESIRLQSEDFIRDTAVIIVVNRGVSAPPEVCENNADTLKYLRSARFPFDLGIVDASTNNLVLPDRIAGVGVARKLGLDMALSYSTPDTLLFSTDADCTLSKNYLKSLSEDRRTKRWQAGVVGFAHRRMGDPVVDKGITAFEEFLITTAEKLKDAGSIYGYPALGSTMVTTAGAYVAVGGMPRKKAAEDFYFLQELAKYCGVRWIRDILVHPSARPENRVYLGTGFRMSQAQSGMDMSSLHYSEIAFTILKAWLALGKSARAKRLDPVLEESRRIHPLMPSILKAEKIESVWEGLQRSSPSDTHFSMQFNRWFDGLKTHRLLKKLSGDSQNNLSK